MRYVIIGNSAAGVRGAETLRSLDSQAEIIMISQENEPAYSRCLLPDFLAGERDEETLRIRPPDFYKKHQIETKFGHTAEAIDPKGHKVKLGNGSEVPYHKVLITTGSSIFIPPLPGFDGKNIFGLRELADAQNILKTAVQSRQIVVVGGGFVGLEAAYALRSRGLDVTVVEKMPDILPQQFDSLAAGILKRRMEREGIRFITGKGIQAIEHPGFWSRFFGRMSMSVALEDGENLQADMVVVAVGTRANTELVQGTGIAVNRGILVNDYMETNVSDIYAAGDVTETKDVVTGSVGLTPIWPNASTQGRIAAYNMAGIPKPYGGLVGMQNSVEFCEIPAIAMGLAQGTEEEYEILRQYLPEQNYYKKLVIKNDTLVGLTLVGKINQAGIYGALIKTKTKITSFKKILLRDDFNYGHASMVK